MTTPAHQLPADLQDRKDRAEVAKTEAEARSAQAKADKEIADARRDQLTALIPDLSKVKASTLDVKDGPAMGGTVLTYRALAKAAAQVAGRIPGRDREDTRLLITSDPDLASSDAVYQDVNAGLEQLHEMTDRLLVVLEADTVRKFIDPTGLVTALAGAMPAVLSLFSAQRTVRTSAATVTDLAAAAAVAGALTAADGARLAVVHDDFRLTLTSTVRDNAAALTTKRQQLASRKILLEDGRSRAAADLATAQAELKRLEKLYADADTDARRAELEPKVKAAGDDVADLTKANSEATVRLTMIESVTSAIDTFNTAIRAVPAAGGRSPIATAALYENLHTGADRFTHVLLVKAEPGQAQQTTQDRPLWFKDRFTTIVDVNLLFMLLGTRASTIVAAGTVTATAQTHGTIGETATTSVGT